MSWIRLLPRARAVGFAPLVSALLACSPQVQSDYPGEPVTSLRGVVSAPASLEVDYDVTAAIVWVRYEPNGTHHSPLNYTGERVAIDGDFPASFSLDLFGPPPAEAELKTVYNACVRRTGTVAKDSGEGDWDPSSCRGTLIPTGTGYGAWVGFLAAIDASVPDGEIRPEDIVGIDAYRRIYYFDHDSALWHDLEGGLPPRENASLKELILGYDIAATEYRRDPYTAGYHLVDVNPGWIDHITETREECLWKGLCVHWTSADAVAQYLDDREFEECLDLYPENPTCTAFDREGDLDGEPASSIECYQAYSDNVLLYNDCPAGTLDSLGIIVPDEGDPNHGLDQLVTIELGKDLWDAAWGGSW